MPASRYTPPTPGAELTPEHTRRLQVFLDHGFEFQLFDMFPGFVGVKKNHCAALLRPTPEGRLAVGAQPGYLVDGNLSVKVEQAGEEWFVWKKHRVPATPERQHQLSRFEQELRSLLES